MTSNRYAVQYQLAGGGIWTNAQVYIGYYGGGHSSPYINASRYPKQKGIQLSSVNSTLILGLSSMSLLTLLCFKTVLAAIELSLNSAQRVDEISVRVALARHKTKVI